MKLQNKETLKVVDVEIKSAFYDNIVKIKLIDKATGAIIAMYTSLAELNKYWQDYEEPKTYWYISDFGFIREGAIGKYPEDEEDKKEIGNYFETEEEALKVVEKLKAWKRLKDNGFEFTGWKRDEKYYGDFTITATDQTSCNDEDLDLLFGGEE